MLNYKTIYYHINPFIVLITINTLILIFSMYLYNNTTNILIEKTNSKLFILTTAIQANSCFHLALPTIEEAEIIK